MDCSHLQPREFEGVKVIYYIIWWIKEVNAHFNKKIESVIVCGAKNLNIPHAACIVRKSSTKLLTARDRGSLVDSLKSATRILVGSALAPAPVADKTFKPLRTHAARSATYKSITKQ